MTKFFSQLSYSFGNEDWTTEQKALKIKPQDRILCITASGDRPLNLLLNPCKEIVCVDANKIQNHLLSLKCTAMKNFDYDQYLSFLGGTQDSQRSEKLQNIIQKMDAETGQFWLKNKKLVSKGVLYQGAVERLTKNIALLFSFFRKEKLNKLFAINNLEEQRDFIRKEWDHPYLKKAFELVLSPFLTKMFTHDPGLYTNVEKIIKPGIYIYERMNKSLNYSLAKENLLISLILKGKVSQEAFPPYLTREGSELIKTRLNCLSIQTTDVVKYLESVPEHSFDCFSLSDVASYLGQEDFVRMLRGIYRAAKPGARFSIRQFLSFHQVPEDLEPLFSRDSALEHQLEKEDRCFVYRFMVGTIVKDSKS